MKFLTKLLASAILLAPAGLAGTASASTSYNNAADFAAAAGAITTIDFGACGAGSSPLAANATLAGSGLCSGLPSGIDFAPTTGGKLFVVPINLAKNPTVALGLDAPKGGAISFTLGSLATSFGAHFFQNFGLGAQSDNSVPFTISFYNDGTPSESSVVSVYPFEGDFYGLTGLIAFNQVTISQADGYAVIDDVSFGSSAVVATAAPEPATWAMMLLGFGAAGFAMRRAPRRAGGTAKA